MPVLVFFSCEFLFVFYFFLWDCCMMQHFVPDRQHRGLLGKVVSKKCTFHQEQCSGSNLVSGEIHFAFLGIRSKSSLCRNALRHFFRCSLLSLRATVIKWMSRRGQTYHWDPQSREMAFFPQVFFSKVGELQVWPFGSWIICKPVFTGACSSFLLQEGGIHSYHSRK